MTNLFTAAAFSVAIGQSIYVDNDSQTDWNFQLRGGVENVYVVAGWEQPKLKVLGQPIADSDAYSIGVGARKQWDDFSVFLETGMVLMDESPNHSVQQEVVYTQLANNHAVTGRDFYWDDNDYSTSYDVEDGLFLRVGLGYNLTENVAVTASYRASQLDAEMSMVSEDGRHEWREDTTVDLGAFEVAVRWEF
jgi:hypothetical protein